MRLRLLPPRKCLLEVAARHRSGVGEKPAAIIFRPSMWSAGRLTDLIAVNSDPLIWNSEKRFSAASPATIVRSLAIERPTICSFMSPMSDQNQGTPCKVHVAGDGAGGEFRLVRGVVHRFQPDIGTGMPMAVVDGVADRQDFRNGCPHLRVDANAVSDRKPGDFGEVGVGDRTDADQHHVGTMAPGPGCAGRNAAVFCLEALDGSPHQQPYAGGGEPCGDVAGNGLRYGAAEQPFLRLDDRHLAPAGRKLRGDLKPDEPSAKHDDIFGVGCMVADGAGVGDGAQREHAGEFCAGERQRAGTGAGSEDQPSKPSCAPSSKVSCRAVVSMAATR